MMDTPEQITLNALKVYQQTVVTKIMPVGNLTKMTTEERELIKNWYRSLEKQ